MKKKIKAYKKKKKILRNLFEHIKINILLEPGQIDIHKSLDRRNTFLPSLIKSTTKIFKK